MKYKRCGDDGYKPVQCPGQLCEVCGGKGHAVESSANLASVLAYQAPSDDKMLSVEEVEAVVWEAENKLYSAPVLIERALGNKGCALD